MSEETYLKTEIDGRGVANVTMDRPDLHNAFDEALIDQLITAFEGLAASDVARVVVLRGEGKSFSAGADLNWMRRMSGYSHEENLNDAQTLAHLLTVIATCPKPVIAAVQGAAFGGGVGLAAACDIAIGSERALFSLSEVKLGLIPSVISPYVIRAIGPRQASRYMLTAERFDAQEACRIGLLHKVVGADELDGAVGEIVEALLGNGANAMGETKDLIAAVMNRSIDQAVIADTATRIARVRASDEGKEGVTAFLEKRSPAWKEM